MNELIFYLAGIFAVIASASVVILKDMVYAALCLALAFLAVAVIYLTLDAAFLAAVQVLIYIGGVITLILFVIMLVKKRE